MSAEGELQKMYRARFGAGLDYRDKVWKVLTAHFQRWIPPDGTVLDLGAGYCEFINNVRARTKYAMDLNPDIHTMASQDVKVLCQDCSKPWPLQEGDLDVVFTSNFLEHLPNKDAIRSALANAYRVLKPGGRFVALGPNIKHTHGAYWDFFDHHVQLTELSLAEVLRTLGFVVEKVVGRFLPYTMAHGRQYPEAMLRTYLALPLCWHFFGKQFLVIARKPIVGPAVGAD